MNLVFDPSLCKRQPTATALFASAIEKESLAHAFLLIGEDFRDKELLAIQMSEYLNCTGTARGTRGACARYLEEKDQCQNCRWIGEKKHPQAFVIVAVDEEGVKGGSTTKITVEKARQLSAELARTSAYKRVVVVEDACEEVLHRPAANALLKTIEEPRASCFFFLFARSAEQVLATVVSRCQVIPVRSSAEKLKGPLAKLQEGGRNLVKHHVTSSVADGERLAEQVSTISKLKFFDWSRRAAAQTSHAKRIYRLREAVSEALELSTVLTELVKDDESDPNAIIDAAVLTEVEIIGSRASDVPLISNYLRFLLDSAERTKLRIEGYVGKKAAIDSFVFEWIDVRQRLFS